MISISKNSWHYRFLKQTSSPTTIKTNLCAYIWQLFSTFVLISWAIASILVVFVVLGLVLFLACGVTNSFAHPAIELFIFVVVGAGVAANLYLLQQYVADKYQDFKLTPLHKTLCKKIEFKD